LQHALSAQHLLTAWEMEARWHVEFTGVELATPVEKAVADLACAVTARVEKAVRALEKDAAGRRRDGDRGRQATTLGRSGDAVQRAQGRRGRTSRRRGGARSR
jgi:hypothetical protein